MIFILSVSLLLPSPGKIQIRSALRENYHNMENITDFWRLKSATMESQLLVFGFVRNSEFTSDFKSNALYMNIPPLISWVVLSYFHVFEHFEIIGKDIKLSDDKLIMIKDNPKSWRNTTFGSIIIPSDIKAIYKWDLKFLWIDSYRKALIGIKSSNEDYDAPLVRRKNDLKYCAFYCKNGRIFRHNQHGSMIYATNATTNHIKTGDIISMELNLESKRIKYLMNDEDLGASNIEIETGKDITYRLAISIQTPKTAVQIIAFQHKLLK
eukprot:488730_1